MLSFERFSLPDITRVARRTMLTTLVVGAVAVLVALVLGHPLVAVGLCIGLGFGILNFRMITASVVRVGRMPVRNKRRPLAFNTFSRLALISVVTLGLLFVNFGLGFGVLGGLALFQVLLLANVARAMFVAGTGGAGGPGGPGGRAGGVPGGGGGGGGGWAPGRRVVGPVGGPVIDASSRQRGEG